MKRDSDKKRIAINTVITYVRLFVVTIIGLLTSRYVLQVLGVSDYGLYGIVGGIIALFSFVSGSLASTTIRFLNVEIGKENGNPNIIFNICNVIHICFAVLLLILAETIGIYYITNYLNVDAGKESDAMFVFQVSTIVACIGLINVPYMATFVAKEKFLLIATVDIINALIKLVAVICLFYYKGNVLLMYALLMSLTTLFSFIIYHYLSYKKWNELVRWNFVRERALYGKVLVFNNYNILATVSSIAKTQGSNILINYFFGTIVNGAYGIARTVQGFVESFMANFDSAAAPKIIQDVGGGNKQGAENIVYSISRYCILMMIMIFFPLYAETEFVLRIWLGEVPEYTVGFCRILLIVILIASTGGGMIQYINASGKIKWFKLQSCFWSLLVLPIGYFIFSIGWDPWWILLLFAISDIFNRACQLALMKSILGFDALNFVQKAWGKPLLVITIITIYLVTCHVLNISEYVSNMIDLFATSVVTILTVWYVGLYNDERQKIYELMKNYIKMI